MEIQFLGIGSGYNPDLPNNNAYFLHGRDLVLIDCGETAFQRIRHRKLLENCEGKIVVLLTHPHSDHAGSLSSVLSYCYYRLGKRAHLVYPSDRIVTWLALMGTPEDQYVYHQSMGRLVEGLDVTAVPAKHLPDILCVGYLLSDGQETVYYSGDSSIIPPEVLLMLKEGRLSRLYQDVNWQPQIPTPLHHLPYQTLCELIPPRLRSKVVCMHLNCDYRAMVTAAGFACAQLDAFSTNHV